MQSDNHADALERLLPEIARRLFTVAPGSPLAELPSAQLKVCALLLDGRRTVSQVAAELRISASAATQIADRLEKAGFVERVPDTEGEHTDRRIRFLALTPTGTALLSARRDERRARVAEALTRLSPEEQKTVRGALEMLLAASREG